MRIKMPKLSFSIWKGGPAWRLSIPIALIPALFLIPSIVEKGYYINLLGIIFMYTVLAQSWNIISGYSGYWSFGHYMFFGIGAYTVGILVTKLSYNAYLATILGGVASFFVAVFLGLILLRIKGPYFAISSLVMAEILKVMAVNEEWLTGGGNGLILPPRYALREFYYAMLLTLLSVTVIAYAIKRSPMGYALFAIRDDETAAETYGINSTKYKILAFAISASFAGIAGGCFAWFVTYIDPYSAFDSTLALLMIVSAVFGGIGTVMGPIIGGFVFTLLMEVLWASFPYIYLIILGVSLVLVMRFIPNGIIERLAQIGQLMRRFGV